MKTPEEIKNEVARNNNFDSFNRAIRYVFGRELTESEKYFIDKIIDEMMKSYHAEMLKSGIRSKALRKRGTDEWYYCDEDEYWFVGRYEIANSIVSSSVDNFPEDAELVPIVIIVQEG